MSTETDFDDDEIMGLFNTGAKSDIPDVQKTDIPEDEEKPKKLPSVPAKNKLAMAKVDTSERNKQAHQDFDYARDSLHETINHGNEALADLVYFAKNSGGPDAFKQVAALMDAMNKSTKQLLELHNQMQTVENRTSNGGDKNPTQQTAQTINNNMTIVEASDGGETVFQGTPEEAMAERKRLREQRAKEKQVN